MVKEESATVWGRVLNISHGNKESRRLKNNGNGEECLDRGPKVIEEQRLYFRNYKQGRTEESRTALIP